MLCINEHKHKIVFDTHNRLHSCERSFTRVVVADDGSEQVSGRNGGGVVDVVH